MNTCTPDQYTNPYPIKEPLTLGKKDDKCKDTRMFRFSEDLGYLFTIDHVCQTCLAAYHIQILFILQGTNSRGNYLQLKNLYCSKIYTWSKKTASID